MEALQFVLCSIPNLREHLSLHRHIINRIVFSLSICSTSLVFSLCNFLKTWLTNPLTVLGKNSIKFMTSAMPVQCSTNRAIKPIGSWSCSEFIIYPWRMNEYECVTCVTCICTVDERLNRRKDARSYICNQTVAKNLSNPVQAWIFFRFFATVWLRI